MSNGRDLITKTNENISVENIDVSLNKTSINIENEAFKQDRLRKPPSDVIFKILSNLKPETILGTVFLVNKKLNSMTKDNQFWLGKFLRHYHHAYPLVIQEYENLFEPKEIEDIDWQKEFLRYRDLEQKKIIDQLSGTIEQKTQEAKKISKFLSIIRENDFEGLFDKENKPIEISYLWLSKLTLNEKTILRTAYDIAHQPILDFIYFHLLLNAIINGVTFEFTKLCYAISCQQKFEDVVEMLLEGDMTTEVYGNQKCNPIHIAAQSGNTKIVNFLIETGFFSANAMDAQGRTPLMYAADSGQTEVIRALLKIKDINLNAAVHHASDSENGKTALHLAADNGHIEIVKLLLDAKADATLETTHMHFLPIHLAARGGKVEIVSALIKANPEAWDNPDAHGQTPLLWAASRGHVCIVEFLLNLTGTLQFYTALKKYQKNTADLNAATKDFNDREENTNRQTALHWASKNGHHEVVSLLLEAGADATLSAEEDECQPLHLASRKGQLAVIRTLLDMKPELLNLSDMYGRTPLIYAVLNNRSAVVQFLLQRKDINLDAQVFGFPLGKLDQDGKTALHYAVESSQHEFVDGLLKAHANVDLTPDIDQTHIIHSAIRDNQTEIVKTLLSYHPELIHLRDSCGYPLLTLAVLKNNLELVKYLLDLKNIDINAKAANDEGKTALQFAAERGLNSIVEILLKKGAKLDINNPLDTTRLNSMVEKEVKHRENLLKFSIFTKPMPTTKPLQSSDISVHRAPIKRRNSF